MNRVSVITLSSMLLIFSTMSGSAAAAGAGVDAGPASVDIVSSALSGANPATCNLPDAGLAIDGSAAFASPAQDWRYVLALLYGGNNLATGVVDCNQDARHTLVANWSNMFQN